MYISSWPHLGYRKTLLQAARLQCFPYTYQNQQSSHDLPSQVARCLTSNRCDVYFTWEKSDGERELRASKPWAAQWIDIHTSGFV